MTWYGVIVLLVVLGGAGWVSWVLYGQKGSPTHCIGCGKCVAEGECVLLRQSAGKSAQKAPEKGRKVS